MLSCRETAELVSQGLDRPLGWGERLGLRLHLLLCAGCRRFERQIARLRAALRGIGRGEDAPGPSLPAEARNRIRQRLAARDRG